MRMRHALAYLGAAAAIGGALACGTTSPSTTTPSPAKSDTTAAAQATGSAAPAAQTSSAAAPAGPKVLLKVSGQGKKNTAQFATSEDWTFAYSFDCTNTYGDESLVGITLYTDGEYDTLLVNEIGKKKSDSSPQYGKPGKHYFEINTDCKWSVTVTG